MKPENMTGSVEETDEEIVVRLEDEANPDFWLELTLKKLRDVLRDE